MIGLIFGILILVVGVGFALVSMQENKKIATGIAIGSLILGVISMILGCLKTVPTGQTGVVTTFGRVEDYTLDAGIHFLAPWKSVIKMDNRTQKQTIELSCFSSDIQEVSVVYTINYQINKANAQEIYRTIGTAYFETIISPKVQEAVKGVIAKYNAEALVESRGTLSKQIEEVLIADLAVYNIELVATSIENLDFTDAFTNAVEQKQVAEQNKLRAQTEQEQATLEAQAAAERQVIQAQADADAAILAAQADAEVQKIGSDAAEYAGQKDAAILSAVGEQLRNHPDLIRYLYYQAWNGELPDTVLGDNSNTLIGIE